MPRLKILNLSTYTTKKIRNVTAGATSATVVAPKFSDTLTLFQPVWQILPHHSRGRTKIFPMVTSSKSGPLKNQKNLLDWAVVIYIPKEKLPHRHGLQMPREEIAFTALHSLILNPNPKFSGTVKAYFVFHICQNFQISLIYAFIGCP